MKFISNNETINHKQQQQQQHKSNLDNKNIIQLEFKSNNYLSFYLLYNIGGIINSPSISLYLNRYYSNNNKNNNNQRYYSYYNSLNHLFKNVETLIDKSLDNNNAIESNRLYLDISNLCEINKQQNISYDDAKIKSIIKNLIIESTFFFENIITNEILIIGKPNCRVISISEIEFLIDEFLTENRSWNFKNIVIGHNDHSGHLLVHLTKIKHQSSRHLFYKEIESLQFTSNHYKRLPLQLNNSSNSNIHQQLKNQISRDSFIKSSKTINNNSSHSGDSNNNYSHSINKCLKENCKLLIHEMNSRGMFSSLHLAAFSLSVSTEYKRMLILNTTEFSYLTNNWDDIYLPISTCNLNNRNRDLDLLLNLQSSTQIINNLTSNQFDESKPISIMTKSYLVYTKFMSSESYPKKWMFQSKRLYRSYVMDWLIRPNHATRKQLEQYKRDIWGDSLKPPSGRCLSIHIRNGDKLAETGVYTPLEHYIDALLNVSRDGTRFKDIFLMTDNNTVIDILTQQQQQIANNNNNNNINDSNNDKEILSKLNIRYLKDIKRSDGDVAADVESGKIASHLKTEIGLQLLSEVLIASDCNFFIGTLSSNIGRAIVEFMTAKTDDSHINWLSVDKSIWVANP